MEASSRRAVMRIPDTFTQVGRSSSAELDVLVPGRGVLGYGTLSDRAVQNKSGSTMST